MSTIRQVLGRMADAWTGFWFTPEDPLSLGVLRVLVGGMMLYTHFVWGLNLEGFFGPDGWQSTEAVRGFFTDDWLPSFWWYVPVEHLRLVHVLCLVPLLMFALGLCTPVTSVLALVITISNSNRAPLANYGMDQILSVLGLYLVIGGSGARFSLDAWRRRRRFERRLDRDYHSVWQPPHTSRARLATRLIQVHFCVIYFFSAISKLQGDAWWNGEAVWMAFANKEYQSIDMTWLARYPWIPQLATHATIYWELSFPFLVWNRTLRPFILLMGVAMHAGIGLCMGMITFGSIMIFGYLGFVPPETMQWLLDGIISRLTAKKRKRRLPGPDETPDGGISSAVDDPATTPAATAINQADSSDSDDALLTLLFVPEVEVPAMADAERLSEPAPSGEPPPPSQGPAAIDQETPISLAVCDPDGKHRPFAHYLSKHSYRPFLSGSPDNLWRHVEQHHLHGAILFVDRLSTEEFALLLGDLTLFPIAELPIVIASQRESRRRRADALKLTRLRTIAIPAAFRDLRTAIEDVLSLPQPDDHTNGVQPPSTNGQAHLPQPTELPVDSSLETSE